MKTYKTLITRRAYALQFTDNGEILNHISMCPENAAVIDAENFHNFVSFDQEEVEEWRQWMTQYAKTTNVNGVPIFNYKKYGLKHFKTRTIVYNITLARER